MEGVIEITITNQDYLDEKGRAFVKNNTQPTDEIIAIDTSKYAEIVTEAQWREWIKLR
jgi:hypothetical protein